MDDFNIQISDELPKNNYISNNSQSIDVLNNSFRLSHSRVLHPHLMKMIKTNRSLLEYALCYLHHTIVNILMLDNLKLPKE